MKTPNYIIAALSTAKFYFGRNCVAGYSIEIHKASRYERATTLEDRCKSVINWANRQIEGSAEIVECPQVTHYEDQFAVINIYDPLMMSLEQYIGSFDHLDATEIHPAFL